MAPAQPMRNDAQTLYLTRHFDAARDRVFRALTEDDRLARWFGPKGFTVAECQIDLRVGGAWRLEMRNPNGNAHTITGVYREIASPKRLVFTWAWEGDDGLGHETLVTIALHEAGPKRTRLELSHELFETGTSRDQHGQGWSGSFECLEEMLAADPAA